MTRHRRRAPSGSRDDELGTVVRAILADREARPGA